MRFHMPWVPNPAVHQKHLLSDEIWMMKNVNLKCFPRETMRISREHVWSQKRQVSYLFSSSETLPKSLETITTCFQKYFHKYEESCKCVFRPWLLRVTMKNSGKCFYLFILLAVYVYVFFYMFSERFTISININDLSWLFSSDEVFLNVCIFVFSNIFDRF